MGRAVSGAILGLTICSSLLGCRCIQVAQRIYPFAVPFVITVAMCSLAGVVAVVKDRRPIIFIQDGLLALSVVFFVLAVANWSGGDDGPGMILVGGVGPLILMGAVLAIGSVFQLARKRDRLR